MAHAQKPDFVFRRNGRVHLNRQGRQFSRLLAAELCASAVVMWDTPSSEIVKSTGYPLHSSVSPSLLLPCVTVCHHVSTGLYLRLTAFPLQQWLHERASMLRYTYIVCLSLRTWELLINCWFRMNYMCVITSSATLTCRPVVGYKLSNLMEFLLHSMHAMGCKRMKTIIRRNTGLISFVYGLISGLQTIKITSLTLYTILFTLSIDFQTIQCDMFRPKVFIFRPF